MSLKVWLPLNGDLENKGCSNITMVNSDVTTDAFGKIGTCYYFNASSYLYENTYNWSNFNSSHFSFCCWYKQPSPVASGNSQIICIGTNSGWNNIRIGLLRRTSSGYPMFSVSDGSNAVKYNCTATTFTLDTWNHIACTYDNGTIKIYLNGILDKTYVTTIIPVLNSSQHLGIGAASNGAEKLTGYLNDIRIYDHALSAAEVKEISQGLVVHYKLDGIDTPNENLGNTSADYHNFADGYSKAASGWGGDAGTVTFHHSGGYAGLPYKELHKTATGTGGIYSKTADDIILESNTTYTMSCWIKSSRNFRPIHYGFNINRGVGNVYITYGSSFDLTTEWQFFSKTFTTTEDQAGSYGEMSIIYDDDATDYYIYYSGFKIEKGTTATRWTPPGIQYTTIQDSSGYNNNGIINGTLNIANNAPRYNYSAYMPKATTITHNRPIFGGIDQEWTCAMWVKLDTTDQAYQELNDFNCGNRITHQANGMPLLYLNQGVNDYYNYGNLAVSANEWTHIAFVFKNSNATKLIYINGVNRTNTGGPNKTSTPVGISDTVTIGKNLAGYISDYRIYCTPLLDSDIKMLYNTNMSIDNLNNIHTFNFEETGNNILAGVPLTKAYGNRGELFTNYNSHGEPEFTANSTSAGTDFIPITPGIYEYDYTITTNAGNMFDIGFERFDKDKTSRSNAACVYIRANTSECTHQHFQGTVDLSTDGVNPCAYIALRVLNGWSGTTSGVTGQATIHNISLRLKSDINKAQLTKQGNLIIEEIKEDTKASFHKLGIVEASTFIEK